MKWLLSLTILVLAPTAQAQCPQLRADCEPDEVLFEAGRHHAAAGAIDDALRVWRQLRSEHPESRWALRALWVEASSLESVALYEEAAATYEAFARR